jgi:uncharacterized repeat protein (TIGR01451 family)
MVKRVLLAVMAVTLLVPATSDAAFPGANGKIAFVRAGDIWTMNPDGTGQVNLTNSDANESSPAWSPDGNKIAFDSNGGSGFERQLYTMFADGTGVTQITFHPGGGSNSRGDPAWSPAGDKLVFVQQHGPFVATINPDGTGETTIFFGDDLFDPEWSPDGTKIAFTNEFTGACAYGIATIDPDGSELFAVTQCAGEWQIGQLPSWSPDGTRIAFSSDEGCAFCGPYHLSKIDRDGTDRVLLTGVEAYEPAWSPDGSKIAYATSHPTLGRVKVVNEDGTNIVDLTDGGQPDWQRLGQPGPEADMLATITDGPDPIPAGGILTYNASAKNLVGPDTATGATLTVNLPAGAFFISATPTQGSCAHASGTVTCNLGNLPQGSSADVQIQVEPRNQGTNVATATAAANEADPVPGNNSAQTTTTVTPGGYPRPKGASPIFASLVPAYRVCSPDQAALVHGPPLAHPSCGSPAQTSGYLTVGSPDANGAAANSIGRVRLVQVGELPINPNNGDQSDVVLELGLTDVRTTPSLADYGGELRTEMTLRITDRQNTPSGAAAATVTDTTLSFDAPCTPTGATTIGSSCSISTTADALIPGMVIEGKRAIWELGRTRVFDGGSDGDAATGPNTLFAVQGVFVP